MKRSIVLCVMGLQLVTAGVSHAQNLLVDGNFEHSTTIPDWELVESIFDQTTMSDRDFGDVNSAQQQNFGPQEGALALWLRAFVGGATAGPNNLTNAVLTKTVPATAGEQYTFSGYSRFEFNYSGGEETLHSSSPLGAVASPTTTTMKLEFLDSVGAVVGTPVLLDVKQDRIAQVGFPDANDNAWYQHTLNGLAPAGTTQARVTAEARKMLRNSGGTESAFYDNFSLTSAAAPTTELLANISLETRPGNFDPAWVVTEVPGGAIPADPTISVADFASRPAGTGQAGVWLRSFTGNVEQPATGTIEQTVPGVPGGEYVLNGWSRFETNFTGGLDGFTTQAVFQLEFLDGANALIGSTVTLDLGDEQSNDNVWREHDLSATAPAGTASVRVRVGGLNMVTNPSGGGQSAFLDDVSLTVATGPGDDADFDDDGDVDGADFLVWQRGVGTNVGATNDVGDADGDGAVDGDDLTIWRGAFGAGTINVAAVPEPTSIATTLVALLTLGAIGSRRRLVS